MVELLVIAATLTLAAWATGSQAYRRTSASRALDRYAQSRGLCFVPSPAAPRGASPKVLGTKEGVDYVIDLYRLAGDMRTRVTVEATRGRAPILSVAQRGAFAWSHAAVLHVGDPELDAAYLVTAGAAEDAEGLKSTSRSLLVLDEREGVWLCSDGLRIALSWRGTESDPVMLDAACNAVVAVAGWHRPDSPYR